ncbi:MAG: hypothetical protein IKE58_08095 [Blautia sp.]|nr:hypothetical protein [Blautia sp.]
MMEQITQFVSSNPMFPTLLVTALVIFFLASVLRFAVRSVIALSCGVYNVMVIIAIFALSMIFSSIRVTGEIPQQLASSMMSQVFSPLLDLFGVYTKSGWDIPVFLYEGGKLLVLAFIIEILERFFNLFGWRKNFFLWCLTEYVLAAAGAFGYYYAWKEIETRVPGERLKLTVTGIFVIAVLITVLSGFLSIFGPLGFLLDSMIYEFFLTAMVTTVATILLAMIVRAMDWMPKIADVIQSFTNVGSTEALISLGGLLLVVSLIWYALFRLVRMNDF